MVQLPPHRAVPVVFNGIVGSARQKCCDVCPLVAVHSVRVEQNPLLALCPRVLPNLWLEMVVPPFSTLLSLSAWQCECDLGPAVRSVRSDVSIHHLILLCCPRPLRHCGGSHAPGSLSRRCSASGGENRFFRHCGNWFGTSAILCFVRFVTRPLTPLTDLLVLLVLRQRGFQFRTWRRRRRVHTPAFQGAQATGKTLLFRFGGNEVAQAF